MILDKKLIRFSYSELRYKFSTKNMKYDQHSNFGNKLNDSDIDHKQSTSVSCLLLGRIQGVFL